MPIFPSVSLLFLSSLALGQTCIAYDYDTAGNRIAKYLCGSSLVAVPGNDLGRTLTNKDELQRLTDLSEPADVDLASLIVFPNPALEYFQISAGGRLPADAQVTVFDAQAKVMQTRRLGDGRFDIQDYTMGTYFIVVHHQEQRFSTLLIKSPN